MLVLALYKPEEYIQIGDDVRIYPRRVHNHIVLAIDAPKEISILRSSAKNKGASNGKNRMSLPKLQRAGDQRRR